MELTSKTGILTAVNPSGRIFHLEDNSIIRRLTEIILRKQGHEIILTAGTIAEALHLIPDILVRERINLALLDYELPDGKGDMVAKAIRKSHLPMGIILFSSLNLDSPKLFDATVQKGTPNLVLVETIGNILKRQKV